MTAPPPEELERVRAQYADLAREVDAFRQTSADTIRELLRVIDEQRAALDDATAAAAASAAMEAGTIGRVLRSLQGVRQRVRHIRTVQRTRAARRRAASRVLAVPDAVRTSPVGLNVTGYINAESGMGEATRCSLRALQHAGVTPVICGDSHLGNFGFYASPEGELVIDLNDFDEAHPGGWEWDLRRLAASIWVAGRENGSTEEQCHASVLACGAAYRDEVRFLAQQPLLMRSYNRLDVGRLHETATEKSLRDEIERSAKRARARTSDRALPRFTAEHEGQRRIVEDPPLITRLAESEFEAVGAALDDYLLTLAPHWRRAVGGYTLLDIAHKVVGVGSVGLRAYVALLEGSSPDDVIFLQLKQARRSVLAKFVHGDSAWHAHQGQRVVEYQQALQTVSDPLLGWTTIEGHHK